jgi:hypothetical protein
VIVDSIEIKWVCCREELIAVPDMLCGVSSAAVMAGCALLMQTAYPEPRALNNYQGLLLMAGDPQDLQDWSLTIDLRLNFLLDLGCIALEFWQTVHRYSKCFLH